MSNNNYKNYKNYSNPKPEAKVELTDAVPEGALETNEDGTVNVYDENNNKVGTIPEEEAEAAATFEEPELVEGTPTEIGYVVDCEKLRVRKEPSKDADVVCELDKGTEVMIEESVNGFFKICTGAGIEGYCMAEYISKE